MHPDDPDRINYKPNARKKALELVGLGYKRNHVAKQVGVCHQTVCNWAVAAGLRGKRGRPRKGRPDADT